MAYIEWSDQLSVKVKEIDAQHKQFIEILNKLHDGIFDIEIQKEVINELVEYATVHFETEEKYMIQFKFSGYEEHKKEHEELTRETINIKNTFKRNKCLLSLAILDFLKDWLEKHLLYMDKKYVQCFNENELH
jgi:hemerythrin